MRLALYVAGMMLLALAGGVTFRVLVRREYRERGRLSPLGSFIQALLFFTYGGFPTLYLSPDWPVVYVDPIMHILGLGCLLIGLGFLLYGMLRLGILRSLGRDETRLEQRGLYRYTRNPQALACGLYVIGFVILWPSWYAVGWGLLYIPLIHAMILAEEEHLSRTHGERYAAYCREVPRYLGLGGSSKP